MSKYTDGFVIPVPQNKLEAYRAMAETASQVWREHGALDYKECILDHSPGECGMSFPQGIQARNDETVVFAWIVYESREHRDAVNKTVMEDPRLKGMCDGGNNMPFDVTRMIYGGFKVVVDAFSDQPSPVGSA
jgi:uncharacterized protein YbaA (DUF1428 family)